MAAHALPVQDAYMSPEVYQHREYLGAPSDVWSLGVVLFAMWVSAA